MSTRKPQLSFGELMRMPRAERWAWIRGELQRGRQAADQDLLGSGLSPADLTEARRAAVKRTWLSWGAFVLSIAALPAMPADLVAMVGVGALWVMVYSAYRAELLRRGRVVPIVEMIASPTLWFPSSRP